MITQNTCKNAISKSYLDETSGNVCSISNIVRSSSFLSDSSEKRNLDVGNDSMVFMNHPIVSYSASNDIADLVQLPQSHNTADIQRCHDMYERCIRDLSYLAPPN